MSAPARQRDLRLDFFRGIGMFIILIAHITDNPWTLWIPARFGFSDATEMFVFCSGMASAIAFGAVFGRAGWLMGTLQIAYRIWQVYWVHLGVFFATLFLMLVLNATGAFPRDEVGKLNLYPFLNNTGPNLLGLMTLTYVPNYFDILPMYLVVLALLPVMMALARLDVRLAILFSLTLWVAATAGLNLPAELWFSKPSDRMWFFNPFAWQLVFFTGFAFMAGWLPLPPVRPALVWLAIAIVVLSVPFAWYKVIGASDFVRDWRRDWAILFNKSDFGLLRHVHFLALAYLAWVAAGPGGARLRRGGWAGRVIALVAAVGQQTLAVFAASMVMARALGAVLHLAGGGALAALAVNLAGFAIIIAVARAAAFFKARPWKPAPARPAAPLVPEAGVADSDHRQAGTRSRAASR
jgi:hypothetical protein